MRSDLNALTDKQRRVFTAVADPDVSHFGLAIGQAAGLETSVYVILRRLEEFGLVKEIWHAQGVLDTRGHRHRRTYELTLLGRSLATLL